MTRLAVAVIGVGHLGKEHARILSSMAEVELVGVVDANLAQAKLVAERCGTQAFGDHRLLPTNVQAAIIAAPTVCHHSVARDLLQRRIALLVEKPLASSFALAQDLVSLASARQTLLQVGHIERFNPAFEELLEHPLRPCYISATRCGGFTGRSTDVGVVFDVMIHDLDLILALTQSPVERVEALGASVLGGHEDMAQARITFANGCIADLSASRVHPEPVRQMRLWGAEGYASIDFATRKLKLMQPSEELRNRQIDSRRLEPALLDSLKTEMFSRFIQSVEIDCNTRHSRDQLTREVEHFLDCVRTGTQPRVDGQAGLNAVHLANQVVMSLRQHHWAGKDESFVGPHQLPTATGRLFDRQATTNRPAA
jgi:predicted dehydrogenase